MVLDHADMSKNSHNNRDHRCDCIVAETSSSGMNKGLLSHIVLQLARVREYLGGQHERHGRCRRLLNGRLYGHRMLYVLRHPLQLNVSGDVLSAIHDAVALHGTQSA